MKFYKDNSNYADKGVSYTIRYSNKYKFNFHYKICHNKLSAIYCDNKHICFFKNGETHNNKNAAIISNDCKRRIYFLNDQVYFKNFYPTYDTMPSEVNLTIDKNFWRRFAKMQTFL